VSEIGKRITVAMITMNEERAVGKVIGDIQKVVPEAEILIVDSSSDRTAEIAQSLGARVIKQFPPRGYGPAMDRTLHASEREVVVTLDCDDTYPVEFIEPMARMVLEDGYDLVDGSRLAGKPQQCRGSTISPTGALLLSPRSPFSIGYAICIVVCAPIERL
jgi:glycosyltransferase involved in cell wall biosynthesis